MAKKPGRMKSIWDNDFYNKPPLPKWCFEVDFTQMVLNKNAASYAPLLNKAIVSCQWGKREISIVKTYYAGIEANFPGRVMNTGELNITFNENTGMQVSRALEELFNGECSNDRYFLGTGNYIFNKDFKKVGRNITLKVIRPDLNMSTGNDYEYVGSVTFYNCILTSINEEEFNYESTDETVTRTARFSYDYMIDNRFDYDGSTMTSLGDND